jgi:hypothetical protein
LPTENLGDDGFFEVAYWVLRAHHIWKAQGKEAALESLKSANTKNDWVRAAVQWLSRRAK